MPDTIMTRAVIVRMKRRAPGEPMESFRTRSMSLKGMTCAIAWLIGQRLSVPRLDGHGRSCPTGSSTGRRKYGSRS